MSTSAQAMRSLQKIDSLSSQQIQHLIHRALQLKKGEICPQPLDVAPVVALAFLEPSTRTRFSFEIAALRLGFKTVQFIGDSSTSMVKGESLHETLQTLIAMRPDLLVVRHNGGSDIDKLISGCGLAVINAGNGSEEHPTQALLDGATIFERRGQIEGEKIVFVGDVEHSRVARSGRILFQKMGAEVAICAPDELLPTTPDWSKSRRFSTIEEALSWSSVCIGLRIQRERHASKASLSQAEYVKKFRLDKTNLVALRGDAIFMHPGPFVDGVDLNHDVLSDSRCAVHEQVTNGVYMRMAVMGEIFGISYS